MDWLLQEFEVENLPLAIEKDWGIVEATSDGGKAVGYRFFPDKVKGEGFFLALFPQNKAVPAIPYAHPKDQNGKSCQSRSGDH